MYRILLLEPTLLSGVLIEPLNALLCRIPVEPRNYDPALHPMESAREYQRALNAAKLQKVFAKPFTASLDGHRDIVSCLCKHAKQLSLVLSGAADGEVRPVCCTCGVIKRSTGFHIPHRSSFRGVIAVVWGYTACINFLLAFALSANAD